MRERGREIGGRDTGRERQERGGDREIAAQTEVWRAQGWEDRTATEAAPPGTDAFFGPQLP